MITRSLGPEAPHVSAVGFGAMPLSIQGRPSDPEIGVRVVHASLDAGMTLIDTADVYCLDDSDIGHNERLVSRALREWQGDRDSIVMATKGGLTRPAGRWERNGHPDHLRQACERSLAAMSVDQIDLYQFHAPDPTVPLEDSVGALAELRQQGKVRWIGLSNVTVDEIKLAESIVPVVTVQNRLSPFFREALDTGVVEYCGNRGIGLLAYSPVGGGRLNKKLPAHPIVAEIAKRHDASTHTVVLAWVLNQGDSVIVIPGARTVEHTVDSASSASLELSADELASIDAAEFSIT
ncbi:MAG: aldo/keto reductase [Gemmatimonadota bacterium]|nr:MAG: aldo/keto reductase [Gemmatimonadota bacterium]